MSFKNVCNNTTKKPTTNLRLNTIQAQRNKKGGKLINQTIPLHKVKDVLEINLKLIKKIPTPS